MRSSVAGLVATIALTLTACTSPTPKADRWQPVDLPGAGRVVTLTATDEGLLVGRYDAGARERASLTVVGPDGSSRPVAMETRWEWAGREAELLSVSEREGEVVAVGGHRAGAHGNVRWTVWSGDLDEVVEQPQRFEVFGGWDAGGLTGTALSQGGPVILGSWAARSRQGLDVAVWTREGDRWSRPARPGTPLAASATRQPSPGAVTDLPDGDLLAVGWVTVLGDRIRDEAVVWTAADPAGPGVRSRSLRPGVGRNDRWRWTAPPTTASSPAAAIRTSSCGGSTSPTTGWPRRGRGRPCPMPCTRRRR